MSLLLPITEIEFRNALIDAAEIGATKALIHVGQLKPYLKLKEAQELYGSGLVKRWINEGLITPVKDGNHSSTVRIDRVQIESVALASNRASYLINILSATK